MPEMSKAFIKTLAIDDVEGLFLSLGEKPYRARQLFNWLYEKNVESFHDMTNFSKELRQALDERYDLSSLVLDDRLVSALDGTEKYLFKTRDGHFIESVLIRRDGTDEGRLTVCVSSQVGCPMGCGFCHKGDGAAFTRDPAHEGLGKRPSDTPDTCGRCHGNDAIVGQGSAGRGNIVDLFRDSIHGKALIKSGLSVAPTCSDCHGSHDIRRKADPASKVFRNTIPATCSSCHVRATCNSACDAARKSRS